MPANDFKIPDDGGAATSGPASPVNDMSRTDLQARAGLYALLARCLESEMDADLLHLFRGPLKQTIDELGLDLGEDVMNARAEDVLENLAEEFTALFVAPGGVLPYRSVFETGRLFQSQADRAEAAYKAAGFAFRNVYSGEFSDHVAVMLAFVGRLFERQLAFDEADNTSAASACAVQRETFLREQLGPWVIGWSRRARGCALHPFYRTILELTEEVVWEDISACSDRATLKRLALSNRRRLMRQTADPDFRKASGL